MTRKLDKNTVRKIAHLARLDKNPSDDFLEKYSKELGAILEYVEKLQEIDTTGINPLDGVRTITVSQLREDKPPENITEYRSIRKNIITNFPVKNGVLLELPGIFENS